MSEHTPTKPTSTTGDRQRFIDEGRIIPAHRRRPMPVAPLGGPFIFSKRVLHMDAAGRRAAAHQVAHPVAGGAIEWDNLKGMKRHG